MDATFRMEISIMCQISTPALHWHNFLYFFSPVSLITAFTFWQPNWLCLAFPLPFINYLTFIIILLNSSRDENITPAASLLYFFYFFCQCTTFFQSMNPSFCKFSLDFALLFSPFIILLKQTMVFSIITKRTALCVFLASPLVNYNDLISS